MFRTHFHEMGAAALLSSIAVGGLSADLIEAITDLPCIAIDSTVDHFTVDTAALLRQATLLTGHSPIFYHRGQGDDSTTLFMETFNVPTMTDFC